MSVVASLHFSCDSPGDVGAVVSQVQNELASIRSGNFPTVEVNDCHGPHTAELRPSWFGEVERVDRGRLTARVEMLQSGRIHHLLIEISD